MTEVRLGDAACCGVQLGVLKCGVIKRPLWCKRPHQCVKTLLSSHGVAAQGWQLKKI